MLASLFYLTVVYVLARCERRRAMGSKPESITDTILPFRPGEPDLCVVGNCPRCGNPIYGRRTASAKAGDVAVKRTCDCKEQGDKLLQTMRTT